MVFAVARTATSTRGPTRPWIVLDFTARRIIVFLCITPDRWIAMAMEWATLAIIVRARRILAKRTVTLVCRATHAAMVRTLIKMASSTRRTTAY